MQQRQYVIYLHENPVTKVVFYVGIGNVRRPYKKDNRSVYWRRYVDKHGEPTVRVIRENLTWDEACDLEKYHISFYGRSGIEPSGTLVNRSTGGVGAPGHSHKLSEESKKKIGDGNRGKVVSAESRAKMSRAKKELQLFAKPIIHKKTGIVYDSVTKAAQQVGVDIKKISYLLRRSVIGKSDEWEYVFDKDRRGNSTKGLKREKYSEERRLALAKCLKGKSSRGKIIHEDTGVVYYSMTLAAEALGVRYTTLRSWVKKNRISKIGTFSYYKDGTET